MNFHILFLMISELSFIVKFKVTDKHYQEFFIFKGNESQARLYRENDVLNLYLNCKQGINHYNYDNISSIFEFSWSDFSVNDIQMNAVETTNKTDFVFTDFIFSSPVIEIDDDHSIKPLVNSLGEIKSFNYGYLILIMIVLMILIKADFRTLTNAMKLFQKVQESDYVSMNNLQSS